MTIEQLETRLEDEYFEDLEDSGITFLEYDPTETHVKDEFVVSYNEMSRQLGYVDFADYIQKQLKEDGIDQPDWVCQWLRYMLSSKADTNRPIRLIGTDTEYGLVKDVPTNKESVIL